MNTLDGGKLCHYISPLVSKCDTFVKFNLSILYIRKIHQFTLGFFFLFNFTVHLKYFINYFIILIILQIRTDVQTFYIVCYIEKVKHSLLDLLDFEIHRHPIFIL